MSTPRLTHTLSITLLIASVVAIVTGGTGCAAAGRVASALFIHVEEKHDLAEIRRDTRRELADQREEARREAAEDEVEQARLNAERAQWEAEFCRCNKEMEQERLRSNIREEVESKLAFKVQQGLEVGELEVDVDKLKQMLEAREKEPVKVPPRPPCPCCDKPCGCGSGWLRRHCPHCRHKHCEAERDCGGPEALAQLERQPLRQPLRPAEIPLKLPVYLTFGMEQPELERARIRREPILEERPCPPCPQACPNYYQNGLPRLPCTDPVPGSLPPGARQPATPMQPVQPIPTQIAPPVPIADPSEVRHQPPASIQPTAYRVSLDPQGSWQPSTAR